MRLVTERLCGCPHAPVGVALLAQELDVVGHNYFCLCSSSVYLFAKKSQTSNETRHVIRMVPSFKNCARMLKAGKAKRAIVGGVDSLAKYTVNGFNSLQIFSDEITRPFDANRKGLNLGEGAAYLVLELEEDTVGKTIYGEVRGFGNSNDAYHPSSMSPEAVGVKGAINGALETADLQPFNISYVNAHGTGTGNNDYTELHGMNQVFESVPPFASTKSFTGHTLAAAGAIEAVYSLMNIQHQEMYPTLNWQTQMPEFEQIPLLDFVEQAEINHVLSNSFGFGGNCSSLILSRV